MSSLRVVPPYEPRPPGSRPSEFIIKCTPGQPGFTVHNVFSGVNKPLDTLEDAETLAHLLGDRVDEIRAYDAKHQATLNAEALSAVLNGPSVQCAATKQTET